MPSDIKAGPTLQDARRAAEVLADEGVGMVLAYGSVARQTAHEGSDIDLVAVYDDLDYSSRWELKGHLQHRCRVATGHPVDVFVTDQPEWRCRTTRVRNSFEAAIATDARLLISRPGRNIEWHKEIGMPATERDEALGRLYEPIRDGQIAATHE